MKAPFQIRKVKVVTITGTTYTIELIHVPTGKLVTANYRQASPVPDRLMLATQARLNTKALLD